MAKTKRKRTAKPKTDKETIDGLGVSFEDAMKALAKAEPTENKTK